MDHGRTENDEANARVEVIPVDSVDLTQGELLGRWVFLFQALRKDLKPLVDGTRMTVNEWAATLKKLLESYFTSENAEEEDSKNHLLGTIAKLTKWIKKSILLYNHSIIQKLR